ncbi:MAG: D-aminoacyl-tRNA deacylase, partial [Pseudomonadota bacterium]|nr:D-aminoacyl-tRNA deacylase [Pseudomonadota bacterium]
MRALIQRVTALKVMIDESIVGKIDTGMLVLVWAMLQDDVQTADDLAAKIAKLRIFQDEDGRMNKSITDICGSALVVSQFTLAAN